MTLPKHEKTVARRPHVKRFIKLHFTDDGTTMWRDGRTIDPKYPNDKRPRSVFIKKFRGRTVVWTVAQIRLLLFLGDLPDNEEVMYLDNDCHNDALDNLRLVRRSPGRKSRRPLKFMKATDYETGIPYGEAIYMLPKGVVRWNSTPPAKGESKPRIPFCYAGRIRIGDNELLLGLFDKPRAAQEAIQAAREAAWLAVLTPNDHDRMAALAELIKKRRSSSLLRDIAAELARLDPPPPHMKIEADLVVSSPVADRLIHDGWHKAGPRYGREGQNRALLGSTILTIQCTA